MTLNKVDGIGFVFLIYIYIYIYINTIYTGFKEISKSNHGVPLLLERQKQLNRWSPLENDDN
ncbi:MAG: hypothetical protein N7Q72_04975, partial [Spiroplasma sp. Tabriz.8]|nr:hypothetical protein [Spiroplasma sp. Tabriz.8]